MKANTSFDRPRRLLDRAARVVFGVTPRWFVISCTDGHLCRVPSGRPGRSLRVLPVLSGKADGVFAPPQPACAAVSDEPSGVPSPVAWTGLRTWAMALSLPHRNVPSSPLSATLACGLIAAEPRVGARAILGAAARARSRRSRSVGTRTRSGLCRVHSAHVTCTDRPA
jgi:hypothetical protein